MATCDINLRELIPIIIRSDNDIFDHIRMVICSVLGSGMSGHVVLAQSCDDPTFMSAVKIMSLLDSDLVAKKRDLFNREIWAMQRLDHPHLMKAAIAMESPRGLYLSMSYFPRGSLEKSLSELTYEKAERYLFQLACAVKYMHDMRIAHCDIKLPNILVKSDEKVILSDFGLCLALPKESDTVPASKTGGTYAYMAPERKAGAKNRQVDPIKMDVYSLGVVLWAMIFKRDPEKQVYDYLLETEVDNEIPYVFRYYLLNMLEVNPNLRFSSAELLKSLTAYLQCRDSLLAPPKQRTVYNRKEDFSRT